MHIYYCFPQTSICLKTFFFAHKFFNNEFFLQIKGTVENVSVHYFCKQYPIILYRKQVYILFKNFFLNTNFSTWIFSANNYHFGKCFCKPSAVNNANNCLFANKYSLQNFFPHTKMNFSTNKLCCRTCFRTLPFLQIKLLFSAIMYSLPKLFSRRQTIQHELFPQINSTVKMFSLTLSANNAYYCFLQTSICLKLFFSHTNFSIMNIFRK